MVSARRSSATTEPAELAIHGGEPVRAAPFPPWPVFTQDQIDAVVGVLRSGKVNYWTGEQGRLFEQEFAEFVGCKHAVALANGTVARELALRSLGIGAGDEVVVPSRTFIASASCVVMCGAKPVVADVDPESQNITARTVERVLTPRTKAIVAVHLAGWPCDMDPILELARQHELKVVEDCAQALGSSYRERSVGSMGDAAAFSFCQDKVMTTGGEGGMLTTNHRGVWERAWSFKDHGKGLAALENREPGPSFRWLHDSFGTNWRMTEMQSAIGRVALTKLPGWVLKRQENARVLTEELVRVRGLRVARPPEWVNHSYYKHYSFVRPAQLRAGWSRDSIVAAVRAEGVPCFSGVCSEIYLEKAFADDLRPARSLEVARTLGETSLMFLVHPTLSTEDMQDTCTAVKKVMRCATES